MKQMLELVNGREGKKNVENRGMALFKIFAFYAKNAEYKNLHGVYPLEELFLWPVPK